MQCFSSTPRKMKWILPKWLPYIYIYIYVCVCVCVCVCVWVWLYTHTHTHTHTHIYIYIYIYIYITCVFCLIASLRQQKNQTKLIQYKILDTIFSRVMKIFNCNVIYVQWWEYKSGHTSPATWSSNPSWMAQGGIFLNYLGVKLSRRHFIVWEIFLCLCGLGAKNRQRNVPYEPWWGSEIRSRVWKGPNYKADSDREGSRATRADMSARKDSMGSVNSQRSDIERWRRWPEMSQHFW